MRSFSPDGCDFVAVRLSLPSQTKLFELLDRKFISEMPQQLPKGIRERVRLVADSILEKDGSVGPLELLMGARWLDTRVFEQWRQGRQEVPCLEPRIQCGADKLSSAFTYFREWVKERGLEPIEFEYRRASVQGTQQLQVTAKGDAELEAFYRTHFTSADPSSKQRKKAERVRAKVPELTVFVQTGDKSQCAECETVLHRGDWFCLEQSQPLCVNCADLDYLEFLPSGDAALTRRAKKHSALSAVVVEFNKRRKRYERRGLLVTAEAIGQAEADCLADAPERAARRVKDAERRVVEDQDFIADFAAAIREQFPSCPADEAQLIAGHAAIRGSGRVGRSAAAKAFDAEAIKLAVIASIRHRHTDYDALLMSGVARREARRRIQSTIERVLAEWKQ